MSSSFSRTLAGMRSVPPTALRAVAIGGGTGLSTLLRGLKRYVAVSGASSSGCADGSCLLADLAAIVTVTDDGGSSGRLREDFNMLPPGDVRNCLVALSEDRPGGPGKHSGHVGTAPCTAPHETTPSG